MSDVHWFSFNPPMWIQAVTEVAGHRFYLSSVRGDGEMEATIRCSTSLIPSVKVPLPLDVDKACVEAVLGVVAERMSVALEDAA